MSQSRKHSAYEAIANILVGYGYNMGLNFFVFPIFGWELSLRTNLTIGAIYTVGSLVRSYGMRRLFNLFQKPRVPVPGDDGTETRYWVAKGLYTGADLLRAGKTAEQISKLNSYGCIRTDDLC